MTFYRLSREAIVRLSYGPLILFIKFGLIRVNLLNPVPIPIPHAITKLFFFFVYIFPIIIQLFAFVTFANFPTFWVNNIIGSYATMEVNKRIFVAFFRNIFDYILFNKCIHIIFPFFPFNTNKIVRNIGISRGPESFKSRNFFELSWKNIENIFYTNT